jgi:toxin ParE1/3/4
MATDPQSWKVRLTAMAKVDIRDIVNWTTERFGGAQAKTYSTTITSALRTLKAGPDAVGVKSRDDLGDGVLILPVSRMGRRGRHLILFRIAPYGDANTLQVLRILHDAMDLPRHLADDDELEH